MALRDRAYKARQAGILLVGVSPDDAATSERASEEHELVQAVLLDPGRRIATLYHAARLGGWLPNRRITYLIDQEGRIEAAHHEELSLEKHLALLPP